MCRKSVFLCKMKFLFCFLCFTFNLKSTQPSIEKNSTTLKAYETLSKPSNDLNNEWHSNLA